MIKKCEDWPLVIPNDDGIRPAGEQDECFYCHQKVGKRHGPECPCVMQLVRAEVSTDTDDKPIGNYDEYLPYHWDESDCDFHWNGSSWCSDNALDTIKWFGTEKARQAQEHIKVIEEDIDNCTCHYLNFTFAKVLDHGPYIYIRETPPEDKAPEFTEKETPPLE